MDPQDELEGNNNADYGLLSEAEREAEFKKQHQEYIAEKQARKKQLMRQIKAEFGSSSSDEDSDEGDEVAQSQSSRSSVPKKFTEQEKRPTLLAAEEAAKLKSNSAADEKIAVLIPPKKSGDWTKQLLLITPGKAIVLSNFSYELKNVSKLKILQDPVMGVPFKTKITYHQTQILVASASNEEILGLPSHFYIFAKLLQQKLLAQGIKLKQFAHQKIHGVPESLITNAFIYGKLNKKSQVLGKWQERFVVINKDGLFSYKKFNERHSWSLNSGTIKEMWTRFEIQDNLIIIKIHHASKKTQFGLPLMDLVNNKNWLFHFYMMIGKK